MPEGVAAQDTRLARAAATLLLAAIGIRVLVAVIAGFVEWHESGSAGFPDAQLRAGDVLSTFGAAGDAAGVLLVIAAAVAVWWCLRIADAAAARLRVATNWAFGAVAASAVVDAIGVGLFESFGDRTAHVLEASGFGLANVIVAVGGITLLQRYDGAIDELAFETGDPDVDAFIFAVDRKSGDVRAFLSARQAARQMHIYWIEDDEFAFYTDEGLVLDASVVGERVVLQPTETVRRDELLAQLREFVARRGIRIDPDDEDEPVAYAVPIARWQGLEMWPPWMRPIGRLFRPRG